METNECVVKSLNRKTRGEQGTLFRVPNPGSEYDNTFTSKEAEDVTLAFCRNEKEAHRALLAECTAKA